MKKIMCLLVIMGSLLFSAVPGQTEDKDYPHRQVEFVIPYDPGGSIDMQSRVYGEAIKSVLKVSVVPTNKPGAGGSIGTTYIMNAKPDGYTIGAASFGPVWGP